VRIEQLVQAEPGWRAVFKEPDGSETVSRILGWAATGTADESELVGLVVDPSEASRIVAAPDAVSPDGGSFTRYRYVPPEPPPAPAAKGPSTEESAQQLAKGLLKRRR
jgi:hypothetical protein